MGDRVLRVLKSILKATHMENVEFGFNMYVSVSDKQKGICIKASFTIFHLNTQNITIDLKACAGNVCGSKNFLELVIYLISLMLICCADKQTQLKIWRYRRFCPQLPTD